MTPDDDLLHPWFYGGPAPEPFRNRDDDLVRQNKLWVQYPAWCKSELEKQRDRAEAKGAPTGEALDEDTNRKKYIRKPKQDQMELWLDALRPHDERIKREATTFERNFLREMWATFKLRRGKKQITQKQFMKLSEISARFLVPSK